MRPYVEKLAIPEGQSCAFLYRRLDGGIPFQWHYHPEFELTLTLNSRGERFVGDNIATYGDGDLALLGPNLPHTWASRSKFIENEPHVAIVVWFRSEWIDALTTTAAELAILKPMLANASRGILFSGAATAAVRPALVELAGFDPAQRLIGLLHVLVTLSRDAAPAGLAGPSWRPKPMTQADWSRIERVLDHFHANCQSRLSMDDLAEVAHLSVSGVNRLLHRHTQMTASDYIAQLRVGRACQLLMSTARPIGHIAADSGYDNLSHFNRQFRALKQTTPRAFRHRHTPEHRPG